MWSLKTNFLKSSIFFYVSVSSEKTQHLVFMQYLHVHMLSYMQDGKSSVKAMRKWQERVENKLADTGDFVTYCCEMRKCAVSGKISRIYGLDFQGVIGSVYIGLFEMGITFVIWQKALELADTTA